VRDLGSERVLEKFEIERVYWSLRNVDWGIVTELDIDLTLAANIDWVHPYKYEKALSLLPHEMIRRIEDVLTPKIVDERVPLREATAYCDEELKIKPGLSLMAVRHLIANQRWDINMRSPIETGKCLALN
jgi:hypothetical protein